jgi:hypothetical protein
MELVRVNDSPDCRNAVFDNVEGEGVEGFAIDVDDVTRSAVDAYSSPSPKAAATAAWVMA